MALELELRWQGGEAFEAVGRPGLVVDGEGQAGPSPVELMGLAVAGCMAADLVTILRKGRHQVRSLSCRLVAERAAEPLRRFLALGLRFAIATDAPDDRIQRALDLSRETYCSCWQSMRQDIAFTATFERLA